MSTKQSTVDYILDQLAPFDNTYAQKMFGEYALYALGKVVGLVCNDTLFIKITEKGKTFVGEHYCEGFAYPGARVSMVIDEDLLENREWLCKLVQITADNLPFPKPKKKKAK